MRASSPGLRHLSWAPPRPVAGTGFAPVGAPVRQAPGGPIRTARQRAPRARTTEGSRVSYDASSDHRPRGSRGRPQAPRHVHRLHRRARPAPPRLRGRRQLGRRGPRRLLRHDRGHAPRRRRRARSATTAAASRSTSSRARSKPAVEVVLTVLHAGGKFDGGGYAVSGGLHGVGVSVVNALSTRARGRGHARRLPLHRSPTRTASRSRTARTGARPPTRTGTTVTFWADDEIFETTDYDFETLSRRFQEMAFLNKGLTHRRCTTSASRPDRRRGRRRRPPTTTAARRHLPLRRRPRRLRQAPQRHARARATRRRSRSRPRTPSAASRVEVAMQWNGGYTESVYTFANTINTHRGRHPRGGLPRGAHHAGQQVRPRVEPAQGEGHQPHRRRHPRGPHRDRRRSSSASRSSRARPRPSSATPRRSRSCRRSSTSGSATGSSSNPAEASDIVRKAVRPRPARGWPPARPATWPAAQGPARVGRPARQAHRLPVDRPRRVRALHRRGRLRRRLGQGRPRLAVPGDPADPRQDPERREGAHRPGAEEQRGPGADHRARHRHPRRLRHREAALPQDRPDGRRRRRRPAHPHAAADAAVPLHAAAGRARPRLPRAAAAVQDQVARRGDSSYAYSDRERDAVIAAGRRRRARSCPRRTASSASRVSAR